MKKRREAQSSALSFMDCICCGFGAVLLLFILTAKKQIISSSTAAQQSQQAAETLQAAIEEQQAAQRALDKEIEALAPQADSNAAASLAQLAAEQERLAQAVQDQAQALQSLETQTPTTAAPAARERPSADQSYLSGLRLRGPRAVILLESSGSMLADNATDAHSIMQQGSWQQSAKWRRAKGALKAVLAAIPKGTQVAVLQMRESTSPLSGSPQNPFIDPYDNAALISLLDRLENLAASGGADLAQGLRTVATLPQRASSLLLIGDGLPTAPAPNGRGLTETERVQLFNQAVATRPNYPVNVILLPFQGDPAAAGLFWQLSGRSGGVTLIPDNDWPSL